MQQPPMGLTSFEARLHILDQINSPDTRVFVPRWVNMRNHIVYKFFICSKRGDLFVNGDDVFMDSLKNIWKDSGLWGQSHFLGLYREIKPSALIRNLKKFENPLQENRIAQKYILGLVTREHALYALRSPTDI